MEKFDYFNKINTPMCICDREWTVIFRNTACKKYSRSPRINSSLKRRFIDGENVAFPDSGSDMFFLTCLINDTYKTAICFGYRGYAILSFPSLIEYDILFADILKNNNTAMVEQIRYLLDNVWAENISEREVVFRTIDKLRRNIYSAIENYVALAAFESEKRVPASFLQLYKFLTQKFVSVANKAGFKVFVDLSDIEELGGTVYTDTMYFAAAISSLMLFCLEISDDKKCLVIPQHLGDTMRNIVKFKCNLAASKFGVTGNLVDFAREFPVEYINFLPIDQLCSALGWSITFDVDSKEELNCSIKIDIAIDNRLIFKSSGNVVALSPEEIVSQIVSAIVFVK